MEGLRLYDRVSAILSLLVVIVQLIPLFIIVPPWIFFNYLKGEFYEKCSRRVMRQNPIPVIHASIVESAVEIAQKLREGVYSSAELVEIAFQHAKLVNSALNAISEQRYESAKKEAIAADAKLNAWRESVRRTSKGDLHPAQLFTLERALKDSLPPFLGVPSSVKECFKAVGMPSQCGGVVSRKSAYHATSDATVLDRMKKAGFIPLFNTTTSELCMWYESSGPAFGITRNPYHTGRMVGGSSGGEATIVSSGAVPVGIGSDIGGSIRMPAAFCGIFGHKPSGALVPSSGQFPTTPYSFLTTGPMTRHARDLWPLLKIMMGYDGEDHACLRGMEKSLAKVNRRGLYFNRMERKQLKNSAESIESIPVPDYIAEEFDEQIPTGVDVTPEASLAKELVPTGSSFIDYSKHTIQSWSDVTIYVVKNVNQVESPPGPSPHPLGCWPVHPSQLDAVDKAVDILVNIYGAKGPVELDLSELRRGFDIWSGSMRNAEEGADFGKLMQKASRELDRKLDGNTELEHFCTKVSPLYGPPPIPNPKTDPKTESQVSSILSSYGCFIRRPSSIFGLIPAVKPYVEKFQNMLPTEGIGYELIGVLCAFWEFLLSGWAIILDLSVMIIRVFFSAPSIFDWPKALVNKYKALRAEYEAQIMANYDKCPIKTYRPTFLAFALSYLPYHVWSLPLYAILWIFNLSPSTLPAVILGQVETIPWRLMRHRLPSIIEQRDRLYDKINGLLSGRAKLLPDGTVDTSTVTPAVPSANGPIPAPNPLPFSPGLLLLPVHPTPPTPHSLPFLGPTNFVYTGLFNVLDTPGTSVPMGVIPTPPASDPTATRGVPGVSPGGVGIRPSHFYSGLPTAVQIIGARGFDRLCIAAAEALERETGGWVPPPILAVDNSLQCGALK